MSPTTATFTSTTTSLLPSTRPTVISLSISPTHAFSKPSVPSITLLPGLGIEGDCHCGPTVQHRSRLHLRPVPANLRQVHLIHSELFDEVARPVVVTERGKESTLKKCFFYSVTVFVAISAAVVGNVAPGWVMVNLPKAWGTWRERVVLEVALRATMPLIALCVWLLARRMEKASKEAKMKSSPYDIKPGDLGENVTTRNLDILSLPQDTLLTFINPGEEGLEKERPTIRITGLRNPCPQIDQFAEGLREKCLVKEEGKVVGRKAGIMSVVESGGEIKVGAEIVVRLPDGEKKALGCV